jgi:hypothetical protein
MPKSDIKIYQEADGRVPLLNWLDNVPQKVQDKCIDKIELLEEFGYELRRPHCDILESGVYELRAKWQGVNYRILYGFVGESIVLVSHGCTKKKKVPKIEIKKAIINLKNYIQNPKAHTYAGEL